MEETIKAIQALIAASTNSSNQADKLMAQRLAQWLQDGDSSKLMAIDIARLHTIFEQTGVPTGNGDIQRFSQQYQAQKGPSTNALGGNDTYTAPTPNASLPQPQPGPAPSPKPSGYLPGSGLPAGGSNATNDPKNNGSGTGAYLGNTGIGKGAGSVSAYVSQLLAGEGNAPPVRSVPRGGVPTGQNPTNGGSGAVAPPTGGAGAVPVRPVPSIPAAGPATVVPHYEAAAPGGSTVTPPGTGNPEFTPTAAAMLAQQPDTRLAAMLAKLGYDPSRPGQVGRFLAQILQPMMEMQYRLGAFANGSNGENYDPMNFAGDISNQAASFLQKGANPFAAMRNLGNSVAQNPAFLQMVGAEPDEQNQYKMLQFLNSAQTSGLNPLIQSARGNELDRSLINYQMAGYNAANAGQPGPNNFLAWLQTQPADIQAMILGRR